MTARSLVESSLRLIGVLASGESMGASMAQDGLSRLNRMIKSWNVDGLLIFKVTREEFALTSGQSSRTMGAGGNFNTTRPNRIIRVGVKDGDFEHPVDIINVDQYAAIPDKALSTQFVQRVYVEGTYPLETLNFWPVPSDTRNVAIYSEKVVTSELELSDEISLPDGYDEALEYNLAERLAPEYGRPLDPLVMDTGRELKAALKRQNTKPSLMSTDAPVDRREAYNIYRGD